MTEIFKIKYELAPQITDSMFERKNKPYSLHNFQELLTEAKRTMHYGLAKLGYRSPQLWFLLPEKH